MTRYRRIVKEIVKNEWTSDYADEKYVEVGWGSPLSYTIETEDLTSKISKTAAEKEARDFLISTDWYIIRQADTGVLCPQEIKDARAAARLILNGDN